MIHAPPLLLRKKDPPHLPFLLNPNPNYSLLRSQPPKWPEASPPRLLPLLKDRIFATPFSSSPNFAPDQKVLSFTHTPSPQAIPSGPSASDSSPPVIQGVCGVFRTLSASVSVGSTFREESFSSSSISTIVPPSSSSSRAMKDASARSKVVVRHLPPALSQHAFMEHIGTRFPGSFNWITFFPGKSNIKGSLYSRAYIDFKHPDDVFEFHEKFNGHIFVNEKGTQYKAMVEYAPNQRVPKSWHKKDAREGTISQDPEYLKFVDVLSKPIEYLPSAEVQLERKEAERILNLASGAKDSIIVTPLMEFVRQKRALKSMPQKLLAGSGKMSARGPSPTSLAKMLAKRGSRTSIYSSGSRLKEKSTYGTHSDDRKGRVVIEIKEKKVSQDISRKSVSSNQSSAAIESGVEQSSSQSHMAGKKDNTSTNQVDGAVVNRIIRSLKSPGQSLMNSQSVISDDPTNLPTKQTHRIDIVGRPNGGASSSKTPVLLQKSDQQSDKDKRSSRSHVWHSNAKESNSNTENESQPYHGSTNHTEDKADNAGRRLRNKDRPDRPVWTVRRRGDGSSSANSPTTFNVAPSLSPPGSQRQGKGSKECNNNPVSEAGRPSNRRSSGITAVYGGHEKQVWVAKPVSGS